MAPQLQLSSLQIPSCAPAPTKKAPLPNACFACNPPYEHIRSWLPEQLNDSCAASTRTLVLCFDGTGDSFDEDNSNVVQFFSMLKKDDSSKQLVYYQAGIGTYTSPVLKTPIVSKVSKVLDEMLAWNIDEHVKDGYRFLMQNYVVGSKICIFGFSRGAFTARALAGMLQKVGLLPSYNYEQLPFAWTMYARDDDEGLKLSMAFKRAFSIEVKIDFLGVWDTVQSVGLIPRHLPFSGSNNAIVHFRHALALDEHRVKFFPSYCTGGKPKHGTTDVMTPSSPVASPKSTKSTSAIVAQYEEEVNERSGQETDVLEVFFAGVHSDIGGGSVANDTRHSLARIPLRWMIRECFRTNTGIIFDAHMLKYEVGLDVETITQAPPRLTPVGLRVLSAEEIENGFLSFGRSLFSIISSPFVLVLSPFQKLVVTKNSKLDLAKETIPSDFRGEAYEELNDALSPTYDQIPVHLYWRAMEYIPWITKKQSAEIDGSDSFWSYKFVFNKGKGREVFKPVMKRGMKVHRSVRTRMEADGSVYCPRIRPHVHGKTRPLTTKEWLAENPPFEWVD